MSLGLKKLEFIIKTGQAEEYLNKEKIEEFGIEGTEIVQLIKATGNIEKYLNKETIEDFELKAWHVANLIKATGNIEKYLNKETIEDFGLEAYDVVDLIEATGDIEGYLNKKTIEDLKLNGKQVAFLIAETGNIEKYLNEENINELKLSEEQIVSLIISSGEIKKALDDEILCSKLNDKSIEKLEKIETLLESKNIRINGKMDDKKNVNLPDDITIGIEIESIERRPSRFDYSSVLAQIIAKTENGGWEIDDDGTILDNEGFSLGGEVQSPILSGERAKKSGRTIGNEIESVCNILNIFENYTNDTCGGHVHIGADYLKSTQAYTNLLELWGNTENIMYIIANEEGDVTREGAAEYAQPISGDLENAIESGTINLEEEQDLEKFKEELVKFQKVRYKGINFENLTDKFRKLRNNRIQITKRNNKPKYLD